ncbi:preprotein translocase subunit SecA [compost metagenome]
MSMVNCNPIDEFHAQIIQAYEQIPAKINRESAKMLVKLGGSNDPADWERFGLKNPVSTWTYTINDQYMEYFQNRSAWSLGTIIAYGLRNILRPVFGWSKF